MSIAMERIISRMKSFAMEKMTPKFHRICCAPVPMFYGFSFCPRNCNNKPVNDDTVSALLYKTRGLFFLSPKPLMPVMKLRHRVPKKNPWNGRGAVRIRR